MAKAAFEIGKRLVELCKAGENRKAIEELYSDDHVATEAMAYSEEMGREFRGKDTILKMSDQFMEMNEIHDSKCEGPWPHDDAFICTMSIDLTPKQGPMAGNRMKMDEAVHYGVKDGKICSSTFFYNVEGCE